MTWRRLKLIAEHGMSSNPTAWVIHDIDPKMTGVKYLVRFNGEYIVEYRIKWYCGKSPSRPKLIKKLPPGASRCKACQKAKADPLYWQRIESYNNVTKWKKSHGH